jgi:hypothetical protein
MHTKFQLENFMGGDHFEDLEMGGRISKCILEKQGVWIWMGFM